jgi:hypothetical protein
MSDQDFIFSEFPEIEEDTFVPPMFWGDASGVIASIGISIHQANHLHFRLFFIGGIMRLLPQEWVNSFRAYVALEFYDLEDFIGMTTPYRTEEVNRQIMELCIKASEPLDCEMNGSSPIAVLTRLKNINTSFARIPRFKSHLAKFDGGLYALTRSQECFDSEQILELFCTEPARIIQHAWLKYWQKRKDQASRVIQERVLEWLYRPDGPMMKKGEMHFRSIASGLKQ